MLLSKQQKHLLWLVESLGCLQQVQLCSLMHAAFGSTPEAVASMLRQLRCSNEDLRMEEKFVKTSVSVVNSRRLEAITVMLEVSEGKISDATCHLQAPYLLRFSMGEEKIKVFSVLLLQPGLDRILSNLHFDPTERIIFLCAEGTPIPSLSLPNRHFFAVPIADGTHHFYRDGEL